MEPLISPFHYDLNEKHRNVYSSINKQVAKKPE
jgi:hypothetical protein